MDSVFPLDATLNLRPDKYSHGLREVVVEEVVNGAFDEAVDRLTRAGDGQMAKRQTEEVAMHLSQDFDAFYAQPPLPRQENSDPRELLVISADGKEIVMHPKRMCEATSRSMEREAQTANAAQFRGEKES